jgi:hypothetical protein
MYAAFSAFPSSLGYLERSSGPPSNNLLIDHDLSSGDFKAPFPHCVAEMKLRIRNHILREHDHASGPRKIWKMTDLCALMIDQDLLARVHTEDRFRSIEARDLIIVPFKKDRAVASDPSPPLLERQSRKRFDQRTKVFPLE